jgi:hypothetical protein
VTFGCLQVACKRREWFEAVYLFCDTRLKEQGRGVAYMKVETINDEDYYAKPWEKAKA